MKTSELKRILKRNGCYFHHHGSNHDIWYSPKTNQTFPVDRHDNHEIATGTVNNILKAAGIK